MAISDVYTLDSGLIAQASTSQTPILMLATAATKRNFIVGVRMSIGVTAAAAGNSILFQLARPALTTVNGSSLASGNPHDFSSPASIGQFSTTWTTPPTLGTVLAEWQLPQTTGSMWEEFPPLGYEWGVPAVANNSAAAGIGVHLFVTASVATSTPVFVDIIASE